MKTFHIETDDAHRMASGDEYFAHMSGQRMTWYYRRHTSREDKKRTAEKTWPEKSVNWDTNDMLSA